MTAGRRGVVSVIAIVLAASSLPATTAAARDGHRHNSPVARPVVEQAAGGLGIQTLQALLDEMPRYGYVQDEYLYRGTAHAFEATRTLPADGRWTVRPTTTAPFKTRLVVRRPSDRRSSAAPSSSNGSTSPRASTHHQIGTSDGSS